MLNTSCLFDRLPYSNLRWKDYYFRNQCARSLRRKKQGTRAIFYGKRYVSMVRSMKRRLIAGNEPTMSDYPSHGAANPADFIWKRKAVQSRKRIDRELLGSS